jgi:2,3-bisphosphoglycerate-dependent phosphoglycerate mutase
MRRAVETARPIAEACGVPLQIEPGLHERRIGQLCGLPFADENELWAET